MKSVAQAASMSSLSPSVGRLRAVTAVTPSPNHLDQAVAILRLADPVRHRRSEFTLYRPDPGA